MPRVLAAWLERGSSSVALLAKYSTSVVATASEERSLLASKGLLKHLSFESFRHEVGEAGLICEWLL